MRDDPSTSRGKRVVAVGDIHGDLDALVGILLGAGIIGEEGSWEAGPTRLVLMGDLNDRGPESVAVMSFVMELEALAPSSGGSVAALMGNHELLAVQGMHSHVHPLEVLETEHYWYGERQGLGAVYRGDSPWARWIRSRPSSVVFDNVLFVHAGLGSWAQQLSAEELDAGVRAWTAFFQGVGPKPELETKWLVTQEGQGPLWTDAFSVEASVGDNGVADPLDLEAALAFWGAKRMVVGHKRTRAHGYSIVEAHPVFGNRVVSIDTGISRAIGGRLSALELRDGQVRPLYFDRNDSPTRLTTQLKEQYKLVHD